MTRIFAHRRHLPVCPSTRLPVLLLLLTIATASHAQAPTRTGTQAWALQLKGEIRWQQVTPAGALLVSTDAALSAVDIDRGTLAWEKPELGGLPQDSVRMGADWRRSRWGANTNFARYGEFCSFTLLPGDDQTYSAKWLTDAEVSFRVSEQLTFAAGGQNLFNVFPDRNITVNSFSGIQTFPSHSPFGMNGRTIYGRLVVKL